MKKILLATTVLLSLSLQAAVRPDKIEPAFWWADMTNPELQLMVSGPGIARSTVTVLSADVSVRSVVPAPSMDHLFVYLDLSRAVPGWIRLQFTEGKQKKLVSYELKAREPGSRNRKGFTTSDVLYLIMPDRFANGNPSNDHLPMRNDTSWTDRRDPNARHGGDLAGITSHLDYLTDLGVTAIWLNPVLENDMPGGSYHGYATTDYYRVDPRLGTNAEYVALVEQAHARGLKVVMDMIFNHCGSSHPWVSRPPFPDWFNFGGTYVQTEHAKHSLFDPYASDFDRRLTTDGWFVSSMPDLNQRNPHLARYLVQNSIWWVEYAGIDGIRQDTHPYADADMMARWCSDLLNEYPDFNIVGEAWYNEEPGNAYWQAGSRLNTRSDSKLKSVMDFPLMLKARNAFHQETGWETGLTPLYEHLCYDFMYPDVRHLLVFLENHDSNRFLPEMPTSLDAFTQAYAFLLTSRGIPQLYYGGEILMNGDKTRSDGYVRMDFPGGWSGDPADAFVQEGRTPLQDEAHDILAKLLHWRKGNQVIAEGRLKQFAPRNGAYVFSREFQGKQVLVFLNGRTSRNDLDLARYAEVLRNGRTGKDVLTGRVVQLADTLSMAARESLILEMQ